MSARAEQQHLISYNLDAPRGLIYSSDGGILASNKPTFLLYGLPKAVKDKETTAAKLAKILIDAKKKDVGNLQLDQSCQENDNCPTQQSSQDQGDYFDQIKKLKEDLKNKLSQDLYWVLLDKSVDLDTKKQIEKQGIEGIGFEGQLSRFYPEASTAAHILGFVGSNSVGKQVGYFGVEGFYDGELRGTGGILTEEKDAFGLPILTGNFFQKEPVKGNDLVLNLDRTVQYIVEKDLKAGMQKFGAKSASAVVMDPKTGAVLAMASLPNYDPNHFSDFSKDSFKNSIVADSYEPGSTFKVLVMSAAVNENLVEPDTRCDICAGPVNIDGYSIRTWNNKYFPDTTMTDVIIHSDNTGMVFVGKKLGLDLLYKYPQNFGFGSPTGVDLQDETSPELRPKKDWHEIDLATETFGQGIAVTPMQMVRAVSAIANGGLLMEPHIVQAIKSDKKVTVIAPKVVGRPITKEAASTVTQMMVDAVEKGEAKAFTVPGYRIAGKTGTAQIPVAGHYDPTKTVASFIGFAPANDPKFVMLVIYNQPSSSIYGAETAAPTFFEIAKELFSYYRLAPDE